MKYRDLVFLIIGVIFTLFILGVNIPIFQTLHVDLKISATFAEILTAVGTIGATAAAVFFGLGGKKYIFQPDMQLIDSHLNRQANSNVTEGHTRLKFINSGKSMAKNVIVYIESIKDGALPRSDFLPVPLSWTHDGRYFRNFSPKEVWFLDICRKENIANRKFPILVLAAGQGVKNYEALYPGNTTLILKVSDESGKIRKYSVRLEWQIGQPYVRVTSFDEI